MPLVSIPTTVDSESYKNTTTDDQQSKDPHVTYIGAALPLISTKLLKRIEQRNFIEMAELLESLGYL